MTRIHYWELSNYHSGKLIGQWFDLDGLTYEEHITELTNWLESLPANDGYKCEEWIVGDVEDVPAHCVGEWSIDPEFFTLMEVINNSYYDAEVFHAGVALGIAIDNIEDSYQGKHDNDEALAEDYCESTGMLDDIPDNLKCYFDMEAFGRDLAMDYMEHDGHYFLNC